MTVTFAWLVFLSARLKRVAVDDITLYVSNYLTEIQVLLSEVIHVTENGTLKWFLVEIDLRNPTAFGQHIDFRPRLRFYWSGLHPTVKELQERCQHARGDGKAMNA